MNGVGCYIFIKATLIYLKIFGIEDIVYLHKMKNRMFVK